VSALLVSVAAAAGAAAVGMALAALRARQLGKVAVVDVAWGAGFVLIALVTAVVGTALDEGSGWRRWLVVAMVAVWGLRLAWHVRRRAVGEHQGKEDPRYEEMLGGPLPDVGLATAVRRVFLVQGLAQWLVAVPVAVGAVLVAGWWPAVVAGVAVWAVGLFFEAVGDRQLAAYKAIPKPERPQVMDRGLWAWTRHPNYFGDACVWWGVFVVSAGHPLALPGVVGPLLMTYLLVSVTGKELTERAMSGRPGYAEYVRRTSGFLPLPPGSRPARAT
jgi:steroid 5-alpha reductase family enzyme